jgi:hypothetical protein
MRNSGLGKTPNSVNKSRIFESELADLSVPASGTERALTAQKILELAHKAYFCTLHGIQQNVVNC